MPGSPIRVQVLGAVVGALSSAAEFSRVMRKGTVMTTADLVIHTLRRSDGGPGRLGMVVSKKNRSAVQRNRARRQIREAVRLAGGFGPGTDGVVMLRRGGRVDVNHLTAALLANSRCGP
ncbi:MAG: ribonuclease P protein component [Actinomycetota bacterium]